MRRLWAREILVEYLLFGFVSSFIAHIPGLIDSLWILWDKDHQTLHDKVVETLVVHSEFPIGHPVDAYRGPVGS